MNRAKIVNCGALKSLTVRLLKLFTVECFDCECERPELDNC